jgi:hypothetical protein
VFRSQETSQRTEAGGLEKAERQGREQSEDKGRSKDGGDNGEDMETRAEARMMAEWVPSIYLGEINK